jgi:hypothetical protein
VAVTVIKESTALPLGSADGNFPPVIRRMPPPKVR